MPIAAAVFSGFVAVSWLIGWAFSRGRVGGGIDPAFPSMPVCVLAVALLWAVLFAGTLAAFKLLDRAGAPAGGHLAAHPFAISLVAVALCWAAVLAHLLPRLAAVGWRAFDEPVHHRCAA